MAKATDKMEHYAWLIEVIRFIKVVLISLFIFVLCTVFLAFLLN